MQRTALVLVAAFVISGCITYVDDIGTGTFELTADIPSLAIGSAAFTVDITGDVAAASDHIGAHYWTSSQADPTATIGDSMACGHSAGDVLGSHAVTCSFEAAGTYYVRGHMRHTAEETHNYWTDEVVVEVVDFALGAVAGDAATIGEPFTFTLDVTGEGSTESQHVGAHHWSEPTDDPTGDFALAGACAHTGGALPASFEITCMWNDAGSYQVYGHVRLDNGREDINLWTDAFTVTVA